MPSLNPELKFSAFKMMIRPFVRFCIRHAYTIQEFLRIAKIVFVEVAEEELAKTKQKINVSRLSVLTGIQRFEIDRILADKESVLEGSAGLLARVIGQWMHHPHFTTKSGAPKILQFQGKNNEFRDLVESVSKSINSGTVLFELSRVGAIEKTPRGVRLYDQYFSVQSDPSTGFKILGQDIDSLMQAVEENLFSENEKPNLHIRTEYDSIFAEDIPEIKQWLIERGMEFHKEVRKYLSQHDRDINPRPEAQNQGKVAKIAVSAFSVTTEPQ